MKKLMIVPGTETVIPVIKAAKEMGIYVITADNKPENPGHMISDKYVNVNILDYEALLTESKKLEIDGILTYKCDLAAVPVSYVAEQMGLPAAGPYESVCILQDKGRFRNFLKENDFNTPWAKSYSEKSIALEESNDYPFPVIIKPTDSCSSKGVSVAKNQMELDKAIEYALQYSVSHQFIVEEFLETQGYCSDSDCFVVDGQFKLFTFSAEGFDDRCSNNFCIWWIAWPTQIEKSHIDELKSELQRLISLLGMKTAIYNIAVMVANNGKSYIMECSPRSGGVCIPETIEYATGSDIIRNLIRYSVGIPVVENFNDRFEKSCINFALHSHKNGTFKDVWINDEIKDNIVLLHLRISKGNKIRNADNLSDSIGELRLSFENRYELQKIINDIESYVRVIIE